MGQKRFFEYQADDATFDQLNARTHGIFEPGIYRGFDFKPTGNMNLTLEHGPTGFKRTLIDLSEGPSTGVLVTKQGVIIQEDEDIVVSLDATSGTKRTDLVVCEHKFTEIQGGETAQYIVIKGPQGGSVPALTKPLLQTVVAEIEIPANTANLDNPNVKYRKRLTPSYANNNNFVKRDGGSLLSNLSAGGFKIRDLAAGTSDNDAVNVKQLDDELKKRLPSGVIMMWAGSIASIPEGYVLCNGSLGTPNLRSRFVVGAGSQYSVGNTGGERRVTLTVNQMPTHNHTMGTAGNHSHTGNTNSTGSHRHSGNTGGSGSHNHHYRDGYFAENSAYSYAQLPTGGGNEFQGKAVVGSNDTDIDNQYIQYKNRYTTNGGSHSHSFNTGYAGMHSHTISTNTTGAHQHTINNKGGSESHENRPPYYALAYIMKE